jgi:hypothetical protein
MFKFDSPLSLKKNKFKENIECNEEIIDFIKEKYNIDLDVSNQLFLDEKKKYIFYNELEEKNGQKYNEIIKNNMDINEYSSHSPSCTHLYTMLKTLNIKNTDKILDIGSGLGFALVIFNLFPFLKIDGVEISVKYAEISQKNLNLLSINNIHIFNIDALKFNNYNDYSYLYFYNPFGKDIFEEIIKRIENKDTKIIYMNIHDDEIYILEKYNFRLIKKINGNDRDYFIYDRYIHIIGNI